MNELELLEDADFRARRYVDGVDGQAVQPAAPSRFTMVRLPAALPLSRL